MIYLLLGKYKNIFLTSLNYPVDYQSIKTRPILGLIMTKSQFDGDE